MALLTAIVIFTLLYLDYKRVTKPQPRKFNRRADVKIYPRVMEDQMN